MHQEHLVQFHLYRYKWMKRRNEMEAKNMWFQNQQHHFQGCICRSKIYQIVFIVFIVIGKSKVLICFISRQDAWFAIGVNFCPCNLAISAGKLEQNLLPILWSDLYHPNLFVVQETNTLLLQTDCKSFIWRIYN